MKSTFELEQNIIKCWGIVNDLDNCKNLDEVLIIKKYYELQFELLWKEFENVVAKN